MIFQANPLPPLSGNEQVQQDQSWMQEALLLAKQAYSKDEVPVGAIVVRDNHIIGRGFNQTISHCDPTAHAEIIALRDAAQTIRNYRLLDTTLYVTLEPCTMCAAALVHARIKRLVFGAADAKAGAVISQAHVLDYPFFNHHLPYTGHILSPESGLLLKSFFQSKRLPAREPV
jgi:tRNA(adenine34) deaminase